MDDIFPLEIIFKIISFLDVADVVRLRTVSKQIRDITYDASVWRHLYANSPLPRPHGPFHSQSTRFLENTLVQSTQSGKSWTTHPVSDISRTVRIGGLLIGPRMIFGGWYITLEPFTGIVLRNIDSESFRQVVWERAGEEILSWAACSITSPESQRVYVTLSDRPYSRGKLLEFRMDVDSGHLNHCGSLDIPAASLWPFARLFGDRAPFVFLRGHRLLFDTRTRVFYRFPEKGSGPDESLVVLTATHIIAIYSPRIPQAQTTIQAFMIPTDPTPNDAPLGVLRLTHEGIIHERLLFISLIRNSVAGPISGSTNLRFLGKRSESFFTLFSCVDLILPESRPDSVSQIFIEIQRIFRVEVPLSHVWDGNIFVDASDDGYARGFFATSVRVQSRGRGHAVVDHDNPNYFSFSISKFTIDASRDKCVAVVGKPLPLGWKHFTGPSLVETVFDGVRGRIYSSQPEMDSEFVIRSLVL